MKYYRFFELLTNLRCPNEVTILGVLFNWGLTSVCGFAKGKFIQKVMITLMHKGFPHSNYPQHKQRNNHITPMYWVFIPVYSNQVTSCWTGPYSAWPNKQHHFHRVSYIEILNLNATLVYWEDCEKFWCRVDTCCLVDVVCEDNPDRPSILHHVEFFI